MGNPDINYAPSVREILTAVREARKATGKSQETVAGELGVADPTIGNYENTGGRWMNPIRYLRFLSDHSDRGRGLVLGLLGLEPTREVLDPQLAECFALLESARLSPGWDHFYFVLKRTLGDGRAAPASHERPPIRGLPPAASSAPGRRS